MLIAVAVGSILLSAPSVADTSFKTKDGRTFTLPIEPSDIRSIKATPGDATGTSESTNDRISIPPPQTSENVGSSKTQPSKTSKSAASPGSTLEGGKPRQPDVAIRPQSDPRSKNAVEPSAVALPLRTDETPVAFASFEARCNAPEVVFCDPLDTEGPWGVDASGNRRLMKNNDGTTGLPTQRWWQRWRGVVNKAVGEVEGAIKPSIDTTIKTSGTGSLRFVLPAFSRPAGGGLFTTNFSDDLSQTFGEGDTFYVQYRWRANCDFIYFDCEPESPSFKTERRFFRKISGRPTAFKLSIVGTGDPAIGYSANSCTTLEIVLKHSADHALTGYHSCGWYRGFMEKVGRYSLDRQPGGVYTCPTRFGAPRTKMRWGATANTCFRLDSGRWHTIQMQVSIGTWQPNRGGPNKDIPSNSKIKIWAADEGEPQRLVVAHNLYLRGPGQPDGRYGKIWLMPYMTKKDPNEDHPVGEVWYDELIVSRAFIASPE